MRFVTLLAIMLLSTFATLWSATLDNPWPWKSTSLPELYYEVLSASIPEAARLQAPDGRFRSGMPASAGEDIRSFSMYGMQYIYVPALLYSSGHPSNSLKGDPDVLKMALSAGDYMARIVAADGSFEPKVEGEPVSNLDSHRGLYCWAEAYGLLKDELGPDREKTWREAMIRSGGRLVEDLTARIDRPRYTAPFLGTSPNHFGLWATTILRIGLLTGRQDWVNLANRGLSRFVREIAPGGYWAEHDGPTINYDYLNASVAALYWHYSQDTGALDAMRRNLDFHIHWCTPDGVDIQTVDERNRGDFRVNADWGLFSFCHFPDGRRFSRFKLLAALGDSRSPLEALGLAALGRIAQDAHYHSDGPEAPIPQDAGSWRHSLDRPAAVRKSGPWVWSYSALVSIPSPYNQFFLDRICPISLWHEKSRHIIAGGNSKGQPELATFAVKRKDGVWDYMPLDALIAGGENGDTMCVAVEGFSLRMSIEALSESVALINVSAENTYNTSDSAFLNLPLRLKPGENLIAGEGEPLRLDEKEIKLNGAMLRGSLSYGAWRMAIPEASSFTWPFYTYTPYGPVRVPKRIAQAVGLLSIPLEGDGSWRRVRIEIVD